MTQYDLLDMFKAEPKRWFSVYDIRETTGTRSHNIQTNLMKMRKFNIVQWERRLVRDYSPKELFNKRWVYFYKHKENIRT